jgi:hypothetical protein
MEKWMFCVDILEDWALSYVSILHFWQFIQDREDSLDESKWRDEGKRLIIIEMTDDKILNLNPYNNNN